MHVQHFLNQNLVKMNVPLPHTNRLRKYVLLRKSDCFYIEQGRPTKVWHGLRGQVNGTGLDFMVCRGWGKLRVLHWERLGGLKSPTSTEGENTWAFLTVFVQMWDRGEKRKMRLKAVSSQISKSGARLLYYRG